MLYEYEKRVIGQQVDFDMIQWREHEGPDASLETVDVEILDVFSHCFSDFIFKLVLDDMAVLCHFGGLSYFSEWQDVEGDMRCYKWRAFMDAPDDVFEKDYVKKLLIEGG